MAGAATIIEVGDYEVRVSNPDRVYFPQLGATKLDLVEYYLAVSDGIVRALLLLLGRAAVLHLGLLGGASLGLAQQDGCRTGPTDHWSSDHISLSRSAVQMRGFLMPRASS